MFQPWEAEVVVDVSLARKLIEAQFKSIIIKEIEFIGSGWDNTAYLINKNLVFRFPRHPESVSLLQAECSMLQGIRKFLSLKVPDPKWFGQGIKDAQNFYPYPFAGYKLLKGETGCRLNLTDSERIETAPDLARFLRQLHSIPQADFPQMRIDPSGKLDLGYIMTRSQAYFAQLDLRAVKQFEPVMRKIFQICKEINPANSRAIIHGDFYVRHLIFSKRRRLKGVIDWGDIHIGNPASDLSILFSFLPPEGHALFIQHYGNIDEELLELARLRAAFYGLTLANYGYFTRDEKILKEAKKALYFVCQSMNKP